MTTKHTIELTCDSCGAKGSGIYSWARINISGASDNMGLSPDQNYDLCPECWMKVRNEYVYPRRKFSANT